MRELEHVVHARDAQVTAAHRAGLQPLAERTGTIDARVRPFYARAGRLAAYEAQRGLPLVLALAFTRTP